MTRDIFGITASGNDTSGKLALLNIKPAGSGTAAALDLS